MKRIWTMALRLSLAAACQACTPDDDPDVSGTQRLTEPAGPDSETDTENPSTTHRMKITVGNTSFMATLANNPTANALKVMLPMTVGMTEHAGNEKFCELPGSLPAALSPPGTIRNGEIMLWTS